MYGNFVQALVVPYQGNNLLIVITLFVFYVCCCVLTYFMLGGVINKYKFQIQGLYLKPLKNVSYKRTTSVNQDDSVSET